ncbi:MAG TPA: glycosyltransferase family 39 protein [Burkholderiales bacterium]|nr:glycosyltransferase family 39 protein [Burkholderiales bacterium]
MKTTTIAFLLVFSFAWFANLGQRDLFNTDEGRYAEISREMVASGDWLTPRLNGLKYFEKPPLQYWATAAAFEAFGQSAWSARLWTALTGFLGVLFAAFAAWRLFGAEAGRASGAILGGSLMWVFMGHGSSLDMGVSSFLSLAVGAFALAQRDRVGPGGRRGWMLFGWAACALAVLSKGLIGIVLPAGAVALYVLWQRDWRLLARLELAAGLALFLAIAAPWFVMVSLANHEFAHFFFIHEHFERFLTKEHGRFQPWWYFLPLLALGAVPWTLALPGALVAAARRRPLLSFQPQRFLLVWCVFVFVFFSVSDSKLFAYILPIFPALAMLLGDWLPRIGSRALALLCASAALGGAGLAALTPLATAKLSGDLPPDLVAGFGRGMVVAGAAVVAAGLIATVFALRVRKGAAIGWLAIGGLALTQLLLVGYQSLAPVYSSRQIVERIRPALEAAKRVYFVQLFDHSFLFYSRRTAIMVGYKDELDTSLTWERRNYLDTVEDFSRAWRRDKPAVALMPPAEYDRLRQAGLPMRLLARDPRRVAVGTP